MIKFKSSSEKRRFKDEIKKSIRKVENLPIGHFKNKQLIKLKNLIQP